MLRLEITESAYMDNPEQLVNTVSASCNRQVFLVDMDDFGTGYSSLNMLKQLPVDLLKLDMKFVANAEANKRSASILANVVHMTSDLSLPVLAEGVETRLQADYLEGSGLYLYAGLSVCQTHGAGRTGNFTAPGRCRKTAGGLVNRRCQLQAILRIKTWNCRNYADSSAGRRLPVSGRDGRDSTM
jgi:predicted signal transduction protein with EAL and GGDEF domain